jgi:excinuclease ABC subunit C
VFQFQPSHYPDSVGVYLFRDQSDKVLYVGKAIRLRQRLRSYAAGGDGRAQVPLMLAKATSLEVILTDSEVEALVLENNLIKEHRPRYNLFLKDDKTYPYITVSKELFPRVRLTRTLRSDGSRVYGPFSGVKQIRQFLRDMSARLGLRSCDFAINPESQRLRKHRLCLDYHIGACQGPCETLQTPEAYVERLKVFEDLLNGKVQRAREKALQLMEEAAASESYEEAGRQRDAVVAMDLFASQQKVEKGSSTDTFDAIGFASLDNEACLCVLQIREGRLLGRFQGFFAEALKHRPAALMNRFLGQYYAGGTPLPHRILLSEEPDESPLMTQWLQERKEAMRKEQGGSAAKLQLAWPSRGERHGLVKLAIRNAEQLLEGRQIDRQSRNRIPASIQALQRDLDLPDLPQRIEGFDISHFGGQATVASLVVFEKGRPLKRDYRHYRIREVDGIDDYASMEEVVRRCYSRRLKEGKPMPHLILIDGGKGQLGRAKSVLVELGLPDLPVVGLAKRLEEIFVPGESLPRNLPKNSAANRLLQHVRNEAHRFAVKFNREIRRKEALPDPLAGVPGLGPQVKERLLLAFGGLKGIREADDAEILALKGVGPKLLEALRAMLNSG